MATRRVIQPLKSAAFIAYIGLLLFVMNSVVKSERLDGRHSFSLTTFNPDGKLGQVEWATQAASLGTPVVALKYRNGILMGCPQALPSPLIRDDGTARFCEITRNIVVTHSGLGADGRVVVAAAQRIAVEHAYTFDEAIPIELFLEEISLLFQEYTMKPASRPFGCTLLVAYVPDPRQIDSSDQPEIYRIDPSGSVSSFQNVSVIGSLTNSDFIASLEQLTKNLSSEDPAELRGRLVNAMKSHILKSVSQSEESSESSMPFLTAMLTDTDGLVVRRHLPNSKWSADLEPGEV